MPELPHQSHEISPNTARRLERCRVALSARDADYIAEWPESIRPDDGAYSLSDTIAIAVARLEDLLETQGLLDCTEHATHGVPSCCAGRVQHEITCPRHPSNRRHNG